MIDLTLADSAAKKGARPGIIGNFAKIKHVLRRPGIPGTLTTYENLLLGFTPY